MEIFLRQVFREDLQHLQKKENGSGCSTGSCANQRKNKKNVYMYTRIKARETHILAIKRLTLMCSLWSTSDPQLTPRLAPDVVKFYVNIGGQKWNDIAHTPHFSRSWILHAAAECKIIIRQQRDGSETRDIAQPPFSTFFSFYFQPDCTVNARSSIKYILLARLLHRPRWFSVAAPLPTATISSSR